jgi:hypothetical protein
MQKLYVLTAVFVSLTIAAFAAGKQNNRTSWALTITPKTTQAYLDSVTAAWATHNIVLKFTELKFNPKGTKLLEVSGTVDITVGEQHISSEITQQKFKKAIEIKVNSKPSISVDSK